MSLLGAVRDLPGQDTDADDAIVQCCGSEPYLSTHGICCKNVITPFYPLKVNSKDSLQCCDDQGFNKRTSFCYSCGSKKHVLPVSEKNSWKCCKDQEIYRDKEFRCCDYGVEKGQQCKLHTCDYTGVDPLSSPFSSENKTLAMPFFNPRVHMGTSELLGKPCQSLRGEGG